MKQLITLAAQAERPRGGVKYYVTAGRTEKIAAKRLERALGNMAKLKFISSDGQPMDIRPAVAKNEDSINFPLDMAEFYEISKGLYEKICGWTGYKESSNVIRDIWSMPRKAV